MPQVRVATIGFFDGVHAGHRCLIGQVVAEARCRGGSSLLVTFDRHPSLVLRPEASLALLTTDEERQELLQATGADDIAVIPFTRQLAAMSARAFMDSVLKKELGVQVLVIGYDHRFGHGRKDTFEDYVRYGREIGIEVLQAEELAGVDHVSSSAIRRALQVGDVQHANSMLGYPYFLRGSVVGGFRIGRQLGYPTANILPLDPRKLIPKDGVYAVQVLTNPCESLTEPRQQKPPSVRLDKQPQAGFPGMLYIGERPTFGGGERTIEVHLLHFHGDLYDEQVEIRFLRFVREQRTFASAEELRQQLQADERACE